jgi:hypothetical protein
MFFTEIKVLTNLFLIYYAKKQSYKVFTRDQHFEKITGIILFD